MTVLWGLTPGGTEREAAHTALIGAAALLTGASAGSVRLENGPGGRPRLTGPAARLHASLSHGRGVFAVVAHASTPVGVDVEAVVPLPVLSMADRWLDPVGAAWLARHPEEVRTRAFLWLWTQKEALGKALGQGLRGGVLAERLPLPTRLPEPVSGIGPMRLRPLPDSPAIGSGAFVTPCGGAVIALAVRGPAPAVRVRRLGAPS